MTRETPHCCPVSQPWSTTALRPASPASTKVKSLVSEATVVFSDVSETSAAEIRARSDHVSWFPL